VYDENRVYILYVDMTCARACVCEETHLILFLTFLNDFQRFLSGSDTLRDSLWDIYTHTRVSLLLLLLLYIYFVSLVIFRVDMFLMDFFFHLVTPARSHRPTDRPTDRSTDPSSPSRPPSVRQPHARLRRRSGI